MSTATLIAGIPAENPTLFRRLRLAAGDPAAWTKLDSRTMVVVRDIETARAREAGTADETLCPADLAPPQGLSADRATATAEAVTELFRREGVRQVRTDRTLPFIFAWHLQQAGIEVAYDPELGVLDRRTKGEAELAALARAQGVTEEAMEMACRTVATARAAADARAGGSVCERRSTGRLASAGRQRSGQSALWRTLGSTLAGSDSLRRNQRLRNQS